MGRPRKQPAKPKPKERRIRMGFVDLKDPSKQSLLVWDRPDYRQKYERKGYTLVTPDEVAETDGTMDYQNQEVRNGDRIAYKIPREVLDRERKERIEEHHARVGQNRRREESAVEGMYDVYQDDDRRSPSRIVNIPIDLH